MYQAVDVGSNTHDVSENSIAVKSAFRAVRFGHVEHAVGASTTSQAGALPSAAGNSVKRTPNLVEFVDTSLTLPFLSASQHQKHL